MLKKIIYSLTVISIITIVIFGYFFWQSKLPLISPISFIESYIATPNQRGKTVYGFFPYWNLKYADKLHVNELTHFAYFAADLNQDGSINKKINPKELEPGWNKLNGNEFKKIQYQIKLLNKKSIITITAMDTDVIDGIMDNQENSERAISNILDIYKNYNFDGINIDFEYVGTPKLSTINSFTGFVTSIKSQCMLINSNCEVDVDVFADSARKTRLHDLKALSKIADKIIVMTYDYYRKTSNQAGPVSPMRGACQQDISRNCLEQDINTNISEIISQVPSTKILLGIPFYGYEWQTVDTEFLSNTYKKTGALATYQRIMSMFTDPTISSLSAKWSNTTLSPYITYTQDNLIYQVHFENPESVEMKLDLVKSANLGGVAIWAIGYEVPYLDIWQPISTYLNSQ